MCIYSIFFFNTKKIEKLNFYKYSIQLYIILLLHIVIIRMNLNPPTLHDQFLGTERELYSPTLSTSILSDKIKNAPIQFKYTYITHEVNEKKETIEVPKTIDLGFYIDYEGNAEGRTRYSSDIFKIPKSDFVLLRSQHGCWNATDEQIIRAIMQCVKYFDSTILLADARQALLTIIANEIP